MGFPGTWMTHSESVLYRVVPKCACSTIGQILHYSDQGRFFDGDIHDDKQGLHKWNIPESQPRIETRARDPQSFAFTCVRNPYARILSCFFDKICGIQRNGNRYRGNLVPLLIEKYGVRVGADGEDFDQIASFRRFLLFARDTIRFRRPMDPDIHWSPVASHVGTYTSAGGRYAKIIWTEEFQSGMAEILANIDTPHKVDLANMPRFNESEGHGPKRAHPVADYFDDLSRHLVQDMYRRDFDLFGYDPDDPGTLKPVTQIDLDKVHADLGR